MSQVEKMSHAEVIQKNHDVLQRCTTINLYVIDYLRAEDVLDEAQEYDLKTERNPLRQRNLLFQWLKEVSSQKYESFLKVMKETEQEHVANYLAGSTEVDHLPLSDARYQRLVKIRNKMTNVTRIDNEVIAELRSWKAITMTDADEIRVENADYAKISKLISAIMRRSNHSYNSFQVVLIKTLQMTAANFLSEGEMPAVHVNNNRPDLDGILSSALNEAIQNNSEGDKDIKELLTEMNGFGVNLVRAIPGQSIVIFIYCKTVQNAVKFTQLFNSGRLQDILDGILNRLLLRIEPRYTEKLNSRIILEDDDIVSLEEFTGIEVFYTKQKKTEAKRTESKRTSSSGRTLSSSSPETRPSPPRAKSVQIFKVIVIGDFNVGKTCLTFRFCGGAFSEKFESTIGVDFREKTVTVNEEDIKLEIWDTAGQERFRRSMVQHYYRNVHAVVFVYDVTKIASFESLPHWVDECHRNGLGSNVPRVLVGNKIDLTVKRAVATSMARKFADFHNMVFYETSAKDNSESDNIETIFMSVAKTLCHLEGYVTDREKDVIDVTVNPAKPQSQSCYC